MDINQTIFNSAKWELMNYGCNLDEVSEFIELYSRFDERQKKAISIIEKIMIEHGKKELLNHVVELARVEHGIKELEPRARDHVVHALLSFLLGIYINKNMLKPSGNAVDAFQWKLAGLFHDVGYPVQFSKNILERYTDKINKIKIDLGSKRPDLFFKLVPSGIENLANNVNSLDLIQETLKKWGLNINAANEYNSMIESGKICHGIISSLSVLYVIDIMYDKYNPKREYKDIYKPEGIGWNQRYFENDVVPACSAIFVHNLPARCFSETQIEQSRAPLAFLLKLSDCLQDWERPSAEDPDGIPSDVFKIEMAGSKLVFSVNQEDHKKAILKNLKSSLVLNDVEVV